MKSIIIVTRGIQNTERNIKHSVKFSNTKYGNISVVLAPSRCPENLTSKCPPCYLHPEAHITKLCVVEEKNN